MSESSLFFFGGDGGGVGMGDGAWDVVTRVIGVVG